MAEQVLQFTATIPAGTPQSAPATVPMGFDGWDIESIELEVPAGPAGTMGFYLANSGNPWISRSPGEFFVWNDRAQTFATTSYPTGGGWAVVGYNTDIYDHDVVVRFNVNGVTTASSVASSPVVLTFVETPVVDENVIVL